MDSNLFEVVVNVKFNIFDSDGIFNYSLYWIDGFFYFLGFVFNGGERIFVDVVYIFYGWDSMKIVG